MHPARKTLNGKVIAFALLLLFTSKSPAQNYEPLPETSDDKTLSPYFHVMSDSPGADLLPLKSTRADVRISGVIAEVKVTQVYENQGKSTLEAIYVFPASTRAAVYGMKMTIGERVLQAKIKEREKARQDYEQALKDGKTASLLEQQRPNVFQMNVGNILPGDVIKVELNYTELMVPEDQVYEFVYPTVVGPRYSNQPESGAPDTEKWVANPYLKSGKASPFTFGLDLTVNSGIPIAQLTSPSHEIKAEYTGPNVAHVGLPDSAEAGNRDFVLRYSLAGDKIESGLLLYPGEKENFFLLMLEPPKRVDSRKIVPREYIFVIDVSGSMHGFPIDTAKKLMANLFKDLRPTDYFNVMLFSGGNTVLAEKSLPANKKNIKQALEVITRQRGGGGTELMPALRRALALPRQEGVSTSIVVVTDGYVSVEKDAFEYIQNNLGQANLFSFGIGSSINRYLIEGMARAGMGQPLIILDGKQAAAQAEKFRKYITSPVLTGIKVRFDGLQTSEVTPVSVPDLFSERPVVLFGKYTGKPQGRIKISGLTAAGKFNRTLEVREGLLSKKNSALRYLWARDRILRIADMNKLDPQDKRIKAVTDLGLKYNLMTEYTSFVAIDTLVRTSGKQPVQVKQPLPLPQGVSNYAVGGAMGAAAPVMARSRGRKAKYYASQSADELEAPREEKKPATMSRVRVIRVSGNIDKKTVQAVLQKFDPQLQACLASAQAASPGLSGTLIVNLVLDGQGRVTQVNVERDKLKNQSVRECVLKVLKQIVFAAPRDNKSATLKIRLTFH